MKIPKDSGIKKPTNNPVGLGLYLLQITGNKKPTI
jgi:hypothetical protein